MAEQPSFSHSLSTHRFSEHNSISRRHEQTKDHTDCLVAAPEEYPLTFQHSALQRALKPQNGWRSELEEIMAPRTHVQPEARLGRRKESPG